MIGITRIGRTGAPTGGWKEVEAEQARFEGWCKEVAALPAAEQVRRVVERLAQLNPSFDGKLPRPPDFSRGPGRAAQWPWASRAPNNSATSLDPWSATSRSGMPSPSRSVTSAWAGAATFARTRQDGFASYGLRASTWPPTARRC